MIPSIFKSKLSLRLFKDDYEKKYLAKQENSICINNWKFTCFLVVFSLVTNIMYWTRFHTYDTLTHFHMNKTSSIVALFIHLVQLVLSLFCKKNILIQKLINYVNYFLITFDISFLRFISILIYENTNNFILYYSGYMVEILLRSMFYVYDMMTFTESILFHIFILGSYCAYYLPPTTIEKMYLYLISYVFMCCMISLFAYIIIIEKKELFISKKQEEEKKIWYQQLFESMSTGLLTIKNGRINYANKVLIENFSKYVVKTSSNSLIGYLNSSRALVTESNELQEKVFSEMTIMKLISIHEYNENDDPIIELGKLLKNLEEDYSSKKNLFLNGFCFHNNKSFTNTPENSLILDINYRFFIDEFDGSKNFEFIFNDVTRTQIMQEKKAELKYKTIFFSKVAHEFKNPILCIGELVNSVEERLNLSKLRSKIDPEFNLSTIKALSNYLIILIKDLDYFSNIHLGKDEELEISPVNINEILYFCYNLSTGLLSKYGKKHLSFELINNLKSNVTINTDEIKLKQILVNLLSNSIKFTESGGIQFGVELEGTFLKFFVKDTGKGIDSNKYKDLFKPYIKNMNENNKLGAGLGLSIVKDLTSKLGSKIFFSSDVDKGTTFWFNIPKEDKTFSETNDSIDTIKVDKLVLEKNGVNYLINNCEEIVNIDRKYYSSHHIVDNNKINDDYEKYKMSFNIIVADDEHLIRQTTSRIIKSVACELKINVNIIEATDGVGTLYIVNDFISKGVKIGCIVSDESMTLMNGTYCAEILKKLLTDKGSNLIPYYIVSAYENMRSNSTAIVSFESKPLSKVLASKILGYKK